MGLDMNVMARAKPGFEAEFARLLAQLSAPKPPSPPGFLSRLFGKTPDTPAFDRDAGVARFQEVSDAPFTLLDAPVCGQDPQADAWLTTQFEDGAFGEDVAFTDVAARMAGYRVLSLLGPIDGLPVYSNGGAGYDVDETSFRGAFLNECTFLDEDTLSAAWTIMTPSQFAAFGDALREQAHAYAKAEGVLDVLDRRAPPKDLEGPAERAHIAMSCAKWAAFWSSRGHGMEPYF